MTHHAEQPAIISARPEQAASVLSAAVIADLVAVTVARQVTEPLSELRRFIDRRVAELSTEIHASVTMAEMSEASLAGHIARVQQEVARIVARPTAENRTGGLELEAVVQGTEVAANEIMEAAEAISELIRKGTGPETSSAITHHIQRIFEACSFQDLTSQRVRRAIQHLEQVDVMLNNIFAAEPAPAQPITEGNFGGTGADLAQDMIDQLMG